MMKSKHVYAAAIALCAVVGVAKAGDQKPEWADREVFAINREPAHAFSHRFPSKEAAKPEPNWETPYHPDRYKMLNGKWKFMWSENSASAPKDFYKSSYDVKKWDEISVPLPWQIAGYGQLYYFASGFPMVSEPRNGVQGTLTGNDLDLFNNNPAKIVGKKATEGWVPTAFNPVGSYVTEFTVPEDWDKERVVLHFGGVKSAFYCWVNGKQVGYAQDSFTPSEFDITDYLKSGKNRLAVKVIRWSDGTYMENQDMIRMSGIIRDVYIYQTPKNYIADFFLVPELSDDLAMGSVKLDVELKNRTGKPEARTVEFELYNNQTGKQVVKQSAKTNDGKVQFSATVHNPDRWHVEQPNLYTAIITLKKGWGVEEVLRQDVGFRKFTWDENGNMFLNGARYMIRGVNAHDTSENTGRTISYDEMVKDVTTMRALNINSLRMAHYPKGIRYYALCNRYGIAVADECNLESHTFDRIYADPEVEPLYRPQAVYRMNNMVQRDKNMPSVIMWTYGNEQFPKHIEEVPTLTAMAERTKEIDPTRPGFAERTFQRHNGKNTHKHNIEFVAPMYSGYQDYAKWHKAGTERRPFLMCEYAHAMGNSVPNLKFEWEFFETHPGMNGGYIWDFVDQSILMEVEGAEGKHWTWGGDWGAFDSSKQFCNNGIVLPDRSLNGKSYEVRAVYQQIKFDASEQPGIVKIINKFGTRNLNEFDLSWTLVENGNAIENGNAKLDLAPLSETEFKVPFKSALKKGKRYDINFDVALKADEFRGKKGEFVAAGQIPLQQKAESTDVVGIPKSTLKARTEGDQLIVKINDDSSVVFSQKTGLLEQLIVKGEKILAPAADLAGVEFNPNMCLVDDVAVFNKPQKVKDDIANGLLMMKRSNGRLQVLKSPIGTVRVKAVCDYLVNDGKRGLRHTAYYTILSDGTIRVDNELTKLGLPADSLQLRIGARLPVKTAFDHVEYAALGPYENYDLRKTSVRYGRYESTADAMMGHYVRPQECGNRSGLEWIAMQNANGIGLVVISDETGHGSVMPNTAEEMEVTRHQTALPKKDRWILRYDEKLSALRKAPNYDFADQYAFGYTIRLLDGKASAETVAARAFPANAKRVIHKMGKVTLDGKATELPLLSEKATVEYSSLSEKYNRFPDTLLTTQASAFAFHTDKEENPWLMVDLGFEQKIRALEIVNRQDEKGMMRAKNLTVWFSNDKQKWTEVFNAGEPQKAWTVSLNPSQPARYVKVGLACKEVFNLKGLKIFGVAE